MVALPRTEDECIAELIGGPVRSVGTHTDVAIAVPLALVPRVQPARMRMLLDARPKARLGPIDFVQLWVLRRGLHDLVRTTQRAHRRSAETAIADRARVVVRLVDAMNAFIETFPSELSPRARLSEEVAQTRTTADVTRTLRALLPVLMEPQQAYRRDARTRLSYFESERRRIWAPLPPVGDPRSHDARWIAAAGLRAGLCTSRHVAIMAALGPVLPLGDGCQLLRATDSRKRSRAVCYWDRHMGEAAVAIGMSLPT